MDSAFFALAAESAYNNLMVMQPQFTSGPRSIGDIVGDAIRVCRGNVPLLFRKLLVAAVVELAGKLMIILGINFLGTISKSSPNLVGAVFAGLACLSGMAIATGAEYFLFVAQMAIFRWFAGFSPTYEDAYKFVWSKKFQILGIILLTYFGMFAALAFWTVELVISVAIMGVKSVMFLGAGLVLVGVIGMFVTMFGACVPGTVVAPALAIENRPFSKVVGDNLKLAFAHLGRTSFFMMFIVMVVFTISGVLNLPPGILTGFDMAHNWIELHKYKEPVSLWVQLVASVWRSGTNILLFPIVSIACGFFYLDLRNRTQGLDIARRLEMMQEPVTSEF